ncbi:MAG: hypothetical protein ACRYFA_13085 [Janthinobacterium lividum]
MQEPTVENEAVESHTRLYLFDLMNTANEHGFKADDSWQLMMVSDVERSRIQKDYHPTIATKLAPEMLLPVFHSIKAKLNQTLTDEEQLLNKVNIATNKLKFLVAYIPTRIRS